MKSKILTALVLSLTLAGVWVYPTLAAKTVRSIPIVQPPPVKITPKIDLVFVLDTTGSMSGLISAAKEKIWSIATTMASAQNAPEIRIGLVAYRDRGDAYVTKQVALSSDIDQVYAQLMDFAADGGGDTPEAVNQALHEAVHKLDWRAGDDTYRVVFLVGDAPPHMDYQGDVLFPQILADAAQKGIIINTIQCGNMATTASSWQQIANLGSGQYFSVEQNGSAVALATPFDREIATLSAALDDTRLYYGNTEEKAAKAKKVDATNRLTREASVEVRARRAAFNASATGRRNLYGENDLLEDINRGEVALASMPASELPAVMEKMDADEREAHVSSLASKRQDLAAQIDELTQQRVSFLKSEIAKQGGAKDSLDQKIYEAVRDQAKEVGLLYEDGPEY